MNKPSEKLKYFLRRLITYHIRVVLKDEVIVEGKCTAVDSTMNVYLRAAVEISPNGKQEKRETYTIRGSKILWIEFPDSINTNYLV